jgi:3-phenylpropionate/trans-cinnamate dioxygenase ferredoxin reductase component
VGDQTPFKHVPYFFSDVFDLSCEYWGDASSADELIHRRHLARKSFSVWRLQQQRVVAVFTMNSPEDEREAAPKWIEEKRELYLPRN